MYKECLKLYLSIFLILNAFHCYAQNLVLNSGFEDLKSSFWTITEGIEHNLFYWSSPSKATPDIYNVTNEYVLDSIGVVYGDKSQSMKKLLIPVKPHSGNVMAGIYLYCGNICKTKDYREYLQGEFKESLIPGKKYYFDFWVAYNPLHPIISDDLGIWFTTKKISASVEKIIPVKPQLEKLVFHANEEESWIDEIRSGKWIKVSSTFIPEKEFKFFTIGNFKTSSETLINLIELDSLNKKYTNTGSTYYFVDDFYIGLPGKESSQVYSFSEKDINKKFILKNVAFKFGSYQLEELSTPQLLKLVSFLRKNPIVSARIIGHTDDVGEEDYNIKLSQNRANSVFNFLVEHGIESGRLKYEGFGIKYPLTNNKSEKDRSKNRRVEIELLGPK